MQLLEETGVQHLHIKPETYTYGGKKNKTWLIIKTSLFVRDCSFKLLTLTWKTIVLLDKHSITEKISEITAQASKQLIPCVFHNIFTAAALMLYLLINHIKAFSKTKTTSSYSSFFTLQHKLDNEPDKLNSNVLIHFLELSISHLTWVILDFVGFMGFFSFQILKKVQELHDLFWSYKFLIFIFDIWNRKLSL